MNSLLDADNDEMVREDRELTLGTGTILGIFFGLVLLCGLVFGLGYRMGTRKPVPVLQGAVDGSSGPAANFGGFKPAAGSPVGSAADVPAPRVVEAATPSAARAAGSAAAPVVRQDPANEVRPAATSPVVANQVATPASGQEFVVQIAAVSHEEDAGLLVNALRAKGYPVSAHTEPQDKFFHIQVGPFTNRKDAEAAKQRLVGDGYQPIVK
jgi:DedD protein